MITGLESTLPDLFTGLGFQYFRTEFFVKLFRQVLELPFRFRFYFLNMRDFSILKSEYDLPVKTLREQLLKESDDFMPF